MAVTSVGPLKYAYFAYLSQPKLDRTLYRRIRRTRANRVVELGIRSIERAVRMIGVATRYAPAHHIEYTGIDLFDARPGMVEKLSIKDAHRALKPTGARIRLVPGEPAAGLPGVANALTGTDLLVISSDLDDVALQPIWFYVPRMLMPSSTVLREVRNSKGAITFAPISRHEIDVLADPTVTPRRAA